MKKLSWLSSQGYEVLLDRLQDGVFVVEEQKLAYVNQRLVEMLGYPAAELVGRPFVEVIAPEDRALVFDRHHARLAGKQVPEIYDLRLCTANGAVIHCSINVGLGESTAGNTVTVGSVRDVTEQRAALAELEASKEELKAIFDKLPDVFYRTDMQGIITKVSPSCQHLLGYRPEEMLGTALADYYCDPEQRQRVIEAVLASGGKVTPIEARLRHKDGTISWVTANVIVHIQPDGSPGYIEGVARDINERKLLEEQLIQLTRTDDLTGACNRRYFISKSEEAIHMMKRYQHPASIMVMDLDHFKSVNDKHGHHAGDLALKAFAGACRQEARESDIFGRLGGEEFGLLLPATTIQQARVMAERIRQAVAALEIRLGGQTLRITTSIGLVEFSAAESSVDAVLHRADLAMYQAKAGGRNKVVALTEMYS